MKSGLQQKPTTLAKPGSLRAYIGFLRDNGFIEEADYYEQDVVNVLKRAQIPDPLSLTTRDVVATLYGIVDAAEVSKAVNHHASGANVWDVELSQEVN